MNTVMSAVVPYKEDNIRVFPDVFCTVSTIERNIVECQIDIYVHELHFADGETLFAYKPVNSEIEVNGVVNHINAIYTPRFPEV